MVYVFRYEQTVLKEDIFNSQLLTVLVLNFPLVTVIYSAYFLVQMFMSFPENNLKNIIIWHYDIIDTMVFTKSENDIAV